MKTEEEIQEEFDKCELRNEDRAAFFDGWYKALEWVLK